MAEVEPTALEPHPEHHGGYVIAWTAVCAVLWVLIAIGVFAFL
jgi:hypothetical protein